MTDKVKVIPPVVRDAQALIKEVFDGLAEYNSTLEEDKITLKYTAEVFAIASQILIKVVENKKTPTVH